MSAKRLTFFVINGLFFLLTLGADEGALETRQNTAKTLLSLILEGAPGGSFDILAAYLNLSGLDVTVNDSKMQYTLFAPNDDAFLRTIRDFGYSGENETEAAYYMMGIWTRVGDGNPLPYLTEFLLYHLLPDVVSTEKLRNLDFMTTIQSQLIFRDKDQPFLLIDQAPKLADPNLVSDLDIIASNGVLHVIDRMLFPDNTDPVLIKREDILAVVPVLERKFPELVHYPKLSGVEKDPPSPQASPPNSESGTATAIPYTTEPSEPSDISDRRRNTKQCFPASAVVHTVNGNDISIRNLMAGDAVRVSAISDELSQVYLFTHKIENGLYEFLRISTSGGHSITLTANHYIYANGKLKAASLVGIGDKLQTIDGNATVVTIEQVKDYGLFAPHTVHGDIVINRVVTSTYTQAVHPRLAHTILAPVRFLVRAGIFVEPFGSLLYRGGGVISSILLSGPAALHS